MVYEYDQDMSEDFMVAESGPKRRHWAVIREKLANLLQFADEVTDEVARSNAADDAALREECRAAEPKNAQGSSEC